MIEMPDFRRFARKHARVARGRGVRAAVRGAAAEAGRWALGHVDPSAGARADVIWADEWEICLVADACRYDLWREVAPDYDWLGMGDGWSVGSASPEWYGETFAPEALPDERIGVVTANPFAGKPEGRLPDLLAGASPVERHDAVVYTDHVYRESWGCEVDGGYLDVTHPAVVTDRAWRAWRDHDLDRLVVHYMQPHLPFRARPDWFGRRDGLDDFGESDDTDSPAQPYASEGKEIWKRVRDGELGRDAVWAAYRDNLRWVLEDIDRLRRAVDADLLVTSDHGNGMGEWGVWSHPPNSRVPVLRRVPWVHCEGRGQGGFESVGRGGEGVDAGVDEQLAALGYT